MRKRSILDEYIILIGNPGVGKSTILNGLIGQVKFECGFKAGEGLTKALQLIKHTDGITYGDTPGLSDIKIRELAAQEITKALKRNGKFKQINSTTLQEILILKIKTTWYQIYLKICKISSRNKCLISLF